MGSARAAVPQARRCRRAIFCLCRVSCARRRAGLSLLPRFAEVSIDGSPDFSEVLGNRCRYVSDSRQGPWRRGETRAGCRTAHSGRERCGRARGSAARWVRPHRPSRWTFGMGGVPGSPGMSLTTVWPMGFLRSVIVPVGRQPAHALFSGNFVLVFKAVRPYFPRASRSATSVTSVRSSSRLWMSSLL